MSLGCLARPQVGHETLGLLASVRRRLTALAPLSDRRPATGEFQDAVMLAQFGEVDLDALSA